MSRSPYSDVTTVRCPSCGAATPATADWCGLCWADLRPAPAQPISPQVGESTGPQVGESTGPPVGSPGTQVGESTASTADPTWPCSRCGAAVALELTRCPDCGAGFLAEAAGLGTDAATARLLSLGRGQRLLIGVGASVVLTGLVVALLALVGAVL